MYIFEDSLFYKYEKILFWMAEEKVESDDYCHILRASGKEFAVVNRNPNFPIGYYGVRNSKIEGVDLEIYERSGSSRIEVVGIVPEDIVDVPAYLRGFAEGKIRKACYSGAYMDRTGDEEKLVKIAREAV
jgi:hypothetical protein